MGTTTWQREQQRGRMAETPAEIPVKGWKDTLVRVKEEVSNDRISLISAAMSYYALLALVPAVTSVVLMYAWISDPAEISQHIASVGSFIPKEFQDILNDQLTTLAAKNNSALGFSAIFSLLFSLWSSSKACKAVMEGMNMIHEEKEERGFFKLNLTAIGLTALGVVMGILALLIVAAMPPILDALNLPTWMNTLAGFGGYIILLALFSLYLAVVYRYAPDRNEPKWKWVSRGAIIAAVLWAIASLGFSWYAANMGNFNKSYGSLGAIIILMTWFFISSFVVLMGAEVNAELEHQTKKDTTKGAPKPMGVREARMADTLGKPSR